MARLRSLTKSTVEMPGLQGAPKDLKAMGFGNDSRKSRSLRTDRISQPSCPVKILTKNSSCFGLEELRFATLTRLLSRLFQIGVPISVRHGGGGEEHATGHDHLRSGHLRRARQRDKSQVVEETGTKSERFKKYLISRISLHQRQKLEVSLCIAR